MPPRPLPPLALAVLAALSTQATAMPASPATPRADTTSPARVDTPERPRQAARARVLLPRQVQRGTLLVGQVPPGSQVDIDGAACVPDADGRLHWPVPIDAADTLAVRVVRPGGRVLRLRVRVLPAP